MQTERITFLTTPQNKAAIAARAAARGISTGEYIRRKIDDDDDEPTPEEEAELAALVEQVNIAIPKMAASMDRMIATLESTHEEVDKFLRQQGIRR